MAGGWAAAAAAGSARGAPAGFRRIGCRAEPCQKLRKPAADPTRSQPAGRAGPLPRQPSVTGHPAGQAQLGVGGQHQPGPAVGLLGMPGPRGGPAQGLLTEPDGVLQVEAAHVGAPQHREVRGVRPVPPQPQHLRRSGVGGHTLHLQADQRAAHDRSRPLSSTGGVQLLLRMQPGPGLHLHATVLVIVLNVGGSRAGQVAGLLVSSLAPWRRGRPPLPVATCGGGSA
jgi:hypothetical protein